MFGKKIESKLKNLLLQVSQPVLSKILPFKDIHKGESCYLIGDGVSLKWFDLKEFSSKISIGIGFVAFHKEFKTLNAKYLMVAEPFWFYPGFWTNNITKSASMPDISKAYRNFIEDNQEKKFFLNLSNYPVMRSKNIIYMFRDIKDKRLPVDFITRRINAFHGTLRSSILLAIYMGFDHCYLVGCDYTHVPSRMHHWYEKGRGFFSPHENYNKDFFEMAKEYIDITTITLDGASEFINAMTYKNHTGHDTIYKENWELVDERYLKVLATFPGYSIY